MVYQRRGCVVGIYGDSPLTGFVLSSRSIPDRSLEVDEKKRRAWVAPGEELKRLIREKPYEAVHDLYACLIGFEDYEGMPASVAFNGRMSNRVEPMMQRGEPAGSALMKILEVFPAIRDEDPRIGAVLDMSATRNPYFHFATHHFLDKHPTVQQVWVNPNQAIYITQADFRNVQETGLDRGCTPNELAQQLFDKILGSPPEHGCGAAVCMIEGDDFRFGVYKHNR